MFSKIVKYIVLLLIIVAISIWFAENPGVVSITWLGLIVDVPLALFLIGLGLLVGICALSYRLWIFLRRSPKIYGHYREEKRLHHGYDELSKGMVAIAAGDTTQARKHAKKANNFLKNPTMTMLLSAQAAQLDGDDQAATAFFETMSHEQGMEFLGLRGLYNQAVARGDRDEALKLAQKAFAQKPKTSWLARDLYQLQIEKELWAEAEQTLDGAEALLGTEELSALKQKAILMTKRAEIAIEKQEVDQAIKLLQRAHKYSIAFIPPVLMNVKLYIKQGQKKKGLSLIEEIWERSPHPELYDLYQELLAQPDALKRVRATEKLIAKNKTHPESRLVLVRSHLEAQLWGEARTELEALLKEAPTQRVFALLSELEESERGDLSASQKWLRRMPQSQMDATWTCSSCGTMAEEWSVTCQHCGEFATVNWQAPLNLSRKLMLEQTYQDTPVENVEVEVMEPEPTSKTA